MPFDERGGQRRVGAGEDGLEGGVEGDLVDVHVDGAADAGVDGEVLAGALEEGAQDGLDGGVLEVDGDALVAAAGGVLRPRRRRGGEQDNAQKDKRAGGAEAGAKRVWFVNDVCSWFSPMHFIVAFCH